MHSARVILGHQENPLYLFTLAERAQYQARIAGGTAGIRSEQTIDQPDDHGSGRLISESTSRVIVTHFRAGKRRGSHFKTPLPPASAMHARCAQITHGVEPKSLRSLSRKTPAAQSVS